MTESDALRASTAGICTGSHSLGPQNRLGVIAFNLGKHHAYELAVFSIITALLCVPDITAQSINGLLQRPCDVSGVAGHV